MPCMFQEWHACGMNGMHVFNETYACACVDQSNASVMNAMPECACKTKAPTEVVIVHHLSFRRACKTSKVGCAKLAATTCAEKEATRNMDLKQAQQDQK